MRIISDKKKEQETKWMSLSGKKTKPRIAQIKGCFVCGEGSEL